ncbi:PAS domain-containing protein [Hydrogenophaga sp.]|uniref:PAS domain-containing protein n=1 Tax=Hydrogenophaga sp. TaxID=1904254 RepID=UPI00273059FD|nr:PAS domain-containing protein [Hydrogenophaga sp.]MDP2016392.1 PAS domain-containing protein [Hydrogenophaga sp.]MDP3166149.1 PAS domain-containing protein [Hydrogenophaga sp.]MDP3812352.1 PAS domain-containing protein [Hydrogenophaga sp.]
MTKLSSRLTLPGRWLMPLMLVLFALTASTINYVVQARHVGAQVLDQETRRLRERLSVEQSRLSVQAGVDNQALVRRLVGGMGLYSGMQHTYLLQPNGLVQASLVRSDIGQPFGEVLRQRADLAGLSSVVFNGPSDVAITIFHLGSTRQLVGVVPFTTGRRLIAVVDLGLPEALRFSGMQQEALREGLLLLGLTALLALVVHLVWFRRARHLALALKRMGEGELQARAGLHGNDELAMIGTEADRMAARLQAGQAQIRHLVDLVDRSPVVVMEWRNVPGWPMTYISQSVAQWGYQPSELFDGKVLYADLIHPDDIVRVTAEAARYFKDGPDEHRQEYRLRCANGSWVWVDDRTTLTRDGQGELTGISGVLLDITIQKEAQLAQLEQAEFLRLFYELPFIGMAISSPGSTRWIQVNSQLCAILGYTREELLCMTWAEMTPQPDLDQNYALRDQMLANLTDNYSMRKRFVRKDGSFVHTEIDVRAVRHPDGSLKHLFSTIKDITERLQAEAAIREQTELLELAESMAGLGSWLYDTQTRSVWWSRQMYRNFGRDPALGPPRDLKAYLDCIHPQDRDRADRFMRSIPGNEEMVTAEFRRHPDLGPLRWFRGSVQSGPMPTAGYYQYSGTLLDITQLKLAQTNLEQTNAELEQRVTERTAQLRRLNEELEAFSYTVSHDLKAPLRGIDGYSQLLQEEHGSHLGEEGRQFLVRIRRGVQQMGDLISGLLDYSRMERRTMEHQRVDVPALVAQVIEGFSADIDSTRVQLSLSLEPMVLQLDREGMAVVMRNLVGNAVKFSRAKDQPEVEIGARTEGGSRILWVRDNGVGFDMKYHDRIFGIFQRLQRAEDYQGTGLGLALVAKAVQRMGGRVWAESRPGHGATFFLEFPA